MASLNTHIEDGFFNQDEEDIIKSVLNSDEKGVSGMFTGLFSETEEEVGNAIGNIWEQIRWENVNCMDIDTHIETIGREVQKILGASEMFTKKGINKAITSVKYRVYLYWVKEVLSDSGFEFNREVNDVNNDLSEEIYNLLQSRRLTSFFLFLKSYGILDYSNNIINTFEEEREIKIKNIDKTKLIEQLQDLGAEKVFHGELEDDYFDYPNLELDRGVSKRSFRIRKRTHMDEEGNILKQDNFYTIKRKKEKEKTDGGSRICYEKEFAINEFKLFRDVLERFGLKNSRSKTQSRTSYQVLDTESDVKIKFDICTYKGFDTFLEIECDSQEHIDTFINKLGLQDNPKSSSGSRGFFKEEGRYGEYGNKCEVKDGYSIWPDGTKYPLPVAA